MSVAVGDGSNATSGAGDDVTTTPDDQNIHRQVFDNFQYAIYGWAVPVISLIGLFGNGVAVLVLNHREVSSDTHKNYFWQMLRDYTHSGTEGMRQIASGFSIPFKAYGHLSNPSFVQQYAKLT